MTLTYYHTQEDRGEELLSPVFVYNQKANFNQKANYTSTKPINRKAA